MSLHETAWSPPTPRQMVWPVVSALYRLMLDVMGDDHHADYLEVRVKDVQKREQRLRIQNPQDGDLSVGRDALMVFLDDVQRKAQDPVRVRLVFDWNEEEETCSE